MSLCVYEKHLHVCVWVCVCVCAFVCVCYTVVVLGVFHSPLYTEDPLLHSFIRAQRIRRRDHHQSSLEKMSLFFPYPSTSFDLSQRYLFVSLGRIYSLYLDKNKEGFFSAQRLDVSPPAVRCVHTHTPRTSPTTSSLVETC